MREQFENLCVEIILIDDDVITSSGDHTRFGVMNVSGCGNTPNEVTEQDDIF